jgi:hypothetical protein
MATCDIIESSGVELDIEVEAERSTFPIEAAETMLTREVFNFSFKGKKDVLATNKLCSRDFGFSGLTLKG